MSERALQRVLVAGGPETMTQREAAELAFEVAGKPVRGFITLRSYFEALHAGEDDVG